MNRTLTVVVVATLVTTIGCSKGKSTSPGETSSSSAATSLPAAPRTEMPLADGKTYRHPMGFTFRHPTDWQVKTTSRGLLLVPPQFIYGREGYAVIGTSAGGIKNPDHPKIINFLKRQFIRFPFLQPQGDIETYTTAGGPGARLILAGTNPQGTAMEVQMYIAIIDRYAVGITAFASEDTMSKRQESLEAIFRTFGMDKSQIDGKLVGTWRRQTYTSTGPSPTGSVNTTSVQIMVLAKNGKFYRGGRMLASGATRSGGRNLGSSSVEAGSSGTDPAGKWSAGQGQLWLTWKDGTYSVYRYHLQGKHLLLKWGTSKKNKQLWDRIR